MFKTTQQDNLVLIWVKFEKKILEDLLEFANQWVASKLQQMLCQNLAFISMQLTGNKKKASVLLKVGCIFAFQVCYSTLHRELSKEIN